MYNKHEFILKWNKLVFNTNSDFEKSFYNIEDLKEYIKEYHIDKYYFKIYEEILREIEL